MIHHFDTKVPGYRLQACHDEAPPECADHRLKKRPSRPSEPLSVRSILAALAYTPLATAAGFGAKSGTSVTETGGTSCISRCMTSQTSGTFERRVMFSMLARV